MHYKEYLNAPELSAVYAAKYSSKDVQKTVPEAYRNVGRFWGQFGKSPVVESLVHCDARDMHQIIRVARNAERAQARNQGYKIKRRDRGAGYGGFVSFGVAAAVRQYLRLFYIDQESLARIVLRSRHLRNPVQIFPRWDGDIATATSPLL